MFSFAPIGLGAVCGLLVFHFPVPFLYRFLFWPLIVMVSWGPVAIVPSQRVSRLPLVLGVLHAVLWRLESREVDI